MMYSEPAIHLRLDNSSECGKIIRIFLGFNTGKSGKKKFLFLG